VAAPSVVRSPQALGQVLARLRYQHGLTQEELAEALGVSRRYLSEIENGKQNLFATRLFELLRELGVHLEVVPDSATPAPAVSSGPVPEARQEPRRGAWNGEERS
jgi:HTH-type transcriptional regulator / antitoxin HipB